MSDHSRRLQRPNKLRVSESPGSGAIIIAEVPQPVSFVEFTTKNVQISTQPWVQFPPEGWDKTIKQLFQEMVDAWNEKHAGLRTFVKDLEVGDRFKLPSPDEEALYFVRRFESSGGVGFAVCTKTPDHAYPVRIPMEWPVLEFWKPDSTWPE